MIEVIANTFPESYNYGPMEREILDVTISQIDQKYPNLRNLLLNMTWFGPQFDNRAWHDLEHLLLEKKQVFDNVFLLSTIDPVYLSEDNIQWIKDHSQAQQIIRLGNWENNEYSWNWHAAAAHKLMPIPDVTDIALKQIEHVFLCYQRKPRLHRVEFTKIVLESGLDKKGILTLGGGSQEHADIYAEGHVGPNLTLSENLDDFVFEGEVGGIPCDLFGLGPLSIWQNHFLNIVSETEFNNWHPRFITEKTWKPIIGLRPFLIHGQTRIYSWLRKNGFHTFNHYWPHVPVEESDNQHGTVMSVLHWLCDMDKENLRSMYLDMLPDLHHNRERFLEFGREQYHKMHNLFDVK